MRLDTNGIWHWKYCTTSKRATGYEDIIDSFNVISVEDFKKLTAHEQHKYADIVLKAIRQRNIFPIYYYSLDGIYEELRKCIEYVVPVVRDSVKVHGRAGNTLLDYMFPNLHLADSGNSTANNVYSRFYDDAKLTKCLMRHMKNYPFTSLRTMFFMYGRYFWSTATNFSPMRAKTIYANFCEPGDIVYDFSAGFGGRLLGALSNDAMGLTYIGCEPNSNTYYNLNRLGASIEKVTGRTSSYIIHNVGSEDLQLQPGSIDVAFSCPPYYGLERYGDEPTQSIIRYPVYSDWINKYAKNTLSNIYASLKNGGKLMYIISNIHYRNKKYALAKDWVELTKRVGFTFDKSYPMQTMSRKNSLDAEQLYVFRKEVRNG